MYARYNAELLALAQKIAFCEMNFYGLVRLVNASPEGLTEFFGDYLTQSEYRTG